MEPTVSIVGCAYSETAFFCVRRRISFSVMVPGRLGCRPNPLGALPQTPPGASPLDPSALARCAAGRNTCKDMKEQGETAGK